jgi:hypothetical protein
MRVSGIALVTSVVLVVTLLAAVVNIATAEEAPPWTLQVPSWIWWIALSVLPSLSALLAFWGQQKVVGPRPALDAKVESLRLNLETSSNLIREINAEFELQAAAAERIKAEAEQNQRLAELTLSRREPSEISSSRSRAGHPRSVGASSGCSSSLACSPPYRWALSPTSRLTS